jgi:hypothetical protein
MPIRALNLLFLKHRLKIPGWKSTQIQQSANSPPMNWHFYSLKEPHFHPTTLFSHSIAVIHSLRYQSTNSIRRTCPRIRRPSLAEETPDETHPRTESDQAGQSDERNHGLIEKEANSVPRRIDGGESPYTTTRAGRAASLKPPVAMATHGNLEQPYIYWEWTIGGSGASFLGTPYVGGGTVSRKHSVPPCPLQEVSVTSFVTWS